MSVTPTEAMQWNRRDFPEAAREVLQNAQTRKNVKHATNVIQGKRNKVVAEMPDWEDLREAGSQVKAHTLRHLDYYLTQFEANCTRAGGHVHWAADAAEANRIILGLVQQHQTKEVIKIKTMTSEEIGLNAHLEANGVRPIETDLAELIVQLGKDRPSHFVAPALHVNRQQVRAIFQREMNLPDLGDQPEDLATAARNYLREKYLRIKVAISGANSMIAESGGVCILESEGNR